MTSNDGALLSVRDLSVEFRSPSGPILAVDRVSFDVKPGEVLSIVGESGSGKSVTALSILGLHDEFSGRIANGSIHYGGQDLVKLDTQHLRRIRGTEIAMIFQEPMSALNPVMTIGDQIAESLIVRGMNRRMARERAVDLLDRVRIPSASRRAKEFPHQFSGGMRQRAMIAMALVGNPKLLIADEPTTALDVTIQAQILELLRSLQEETGMSMILITHDMGIVANYADRAQVMYCGRVVESGPVRDLFDRPSHPYTRQLLACIPKLGVVEERMRAIPGFVPSPSSWGDGCRFAGRCELTRSDCTASRPDLREIAPHHQAACFLLEGATIQ